MIELVKMLFTNLGAKRSLRLFAITLFLATVYFILEELDFIDWTLWWVFLVLLALYLATEVLIATFSMANGNERSPKKNERRHSTDAKKRK